MHQSIYSRFLSNLGDRLHFAAHSHHAWPDVSREAHLQYWDDSARLMDEKWGHIFGSVIPKTQKIISQMLNLQDEKQIAFAPNTHELLMRLLSTFPTNRPTRILTTHNEFHSFRRQIQRMEEASMVTVERVQADDLSSNRASFLQSLKKRLKEGSFDLFFISQVFFDSGLALSNEELLELSQSAPEETVICVDGYHSFGALPVDLSKLEGRIFYLGGGYKYAQAGEGVCFIVVPKGEWRPIYTGWFAEMETLSSQKKHSVAYPSNGAAFSGSTFDPSGLYRFNAVWEQFAEMNISTAIIHEQVTRLQELFLKNIKETILKNSTLMNGVENRGHFLAFDLESPEQCSEMHSLLESKGIITDFRGQRLRFGFGLYHHENDVQKLIDRLKS
jgi:selenocysteine lyase/cysteine desulfurase